MTADRGELQLRDLHLRHRGLTEALGTTYAEAAEVCLDRHHTSPAIFIVRHEATGTGQYVTAWTTPVGRTRRAHANIIDATEAGAYGVILAAVEAHLGLVAISRAEQGSGSDFYVGIPGSEVNPADGELDLEEALRLEVSGIDACEDEGPLRRRLRQKVEQAQSGKSSLPAIAGVVGFSLCRVLFRNVP